MTDAYIERNMMSPELDFGIALILVAVFLLLRKIWRGRRRRKGKPVITKTRKKPIGINLETGRFLYVDPSNGKMVYHDSLPETQSEVEEV